MRTNNTGSLVLIWPINSYYKGTTWTVLVTNTEEVDIAPTTGEESNE